MYVTSLPYSTAYPRDTKITNGRMTLLLLANDGKTIHHEIRSSIRKDYLKATGFLK